MQSKVILVDLNGPLGGFSRQRAAWWLIRKCGLMSTARTFMAYLINHKMYKYMLIGNMTEIELWRKTVRGRVTAKEAYEALTVTKRPPNDEMLGLLKTLRRSDYRIYLHSDITEERIEELRSDYGALFAFFAPESQFFSYELRGTKRDSETFAAIASTLSVPPGEIILVDDNPLNIRAARRCGMKTIRFRTPRQTKKALERLLGA